MDITTEILQQHHEQRRAFALLDEIDRDDGAALEAAWARLAHLLEAHAVAEEKYFYPLLLRVGRGPQGDNGPGDETKDAIKDHNEIRDAVSAVAEHEPGTGEWWAAVTAARTANSDHMAEEEREDLADFRRHADLAMRHQAALQFVTYQADHPLDVPSRDKDPGGYVEKEGPASSSDSPAGS